MEGTRVQSDRGWAGALAAASGPTCAALLFTLLASGFVPEVALLGVLVAFCLGLVWVTEEPTRGWSYGRMLRVPAIALITSLMGVVLAWSWPLPTCATIALWLGPEIVLFIQMARFLDPAATWPGGLPAWTWSLPPRLAAGLAGATLTAVACALGGLNDTPLRVGLAIGLVCAMAVAAAIMPLREDFARGEDIGRRLERLAGLLEGDEDQERDPDLEALAAGLQRDLSTAQDRMSEQNRVITELKQSEILNAARIDRLAAGYRRVREAAIGNLGLLTQLRKDVEGSLNDVGVISDSVGQIVGTSQATDALIDEGRQKLRMALESMEYVRLSIEDSLDLVEAFAKRSRQIEDVLKDISDIAYFTRILSLNATIEAARAGEQGKGFRFLADEVQKLAQTITQSTGDITGLLKLVQHESKQTVESVLRSANQVGEAADTVSLLDEALHDIMNELHGMDADLNDAHLMSIRVAETRERAMDALGGLEEGNRQADFSSRVIEDIAAEVLPQAPVTHSRPPEEGEVVAILRRTGPLSTLPQTEPLPAMEWPEELD